MNFTVERSGDMSVTVTALSEEGGIGLYRVALKLPAPAVPGCVTLRWAEPMTDMASLWCPTAGRNRNMPQWFAPRVAAARFCAGAPVLSAVTAEGKNRVTVAWLETVKPTEITFGVDDFHEKDEVIFEAKLFTAATEPLSEYETVLRIDRRPLPLYDAVRAVSLWWRAELGLAKAVPEAARVPLYSSWYNFHQNPDQALLTADLAEAAAMGFETMILDDGWQFEGAGTRDYLKSGDWQVAKDKFPDFAAFVRDAHALGIKVMVWFSVPFAGYETEAYARFKGKLLEEIGGNINAAVLDVRYPEVREYLVGTYLRYVREYGIDGLKLDFIDSFRAAPETPAFGPGMDCPTVEAAVLRLLDEIRAAVTAEKPDFLFEFRQNYVGPAILAYGNMLRVGDCAFDAQTNRIGIVDLRMLASDVAVHSDMLLFSREESLEKCALQLINILFGVPQISVRLDKVTAEQKALVGRFVRYWKANRDVLLDAPPELTGPEMGYTAVSAAAGGKRVTALYGTRAYTLRAEPVQDVFNAAGTAPILVENADRVPVSVTVRDAADAEILSYTAADAAFAVSVPLGGCLVLKR